MQANHHPSRLAPLAPQDDDGLKVAEFRDKVAAEIAKDFPTWKPYIDRIAAVQ